MNCATEFSSVHWRTETRSWYEHSVNLSLVWRRCFQDTKSYRIL